MTLIIEKYFFFHNVEKWQCETRHRFMPRHLLALQSVQLLLLQCDKLFFSCCFSFRDISWLMLRGKIVDFFSPRESYETHNTLYDKNAEFLGAFANLRKVTISFTVSSDRLSVRMKQLGSHWTDFH